MKGGTLLIVAGLLIGYVGITGRWKCFSVFAACLGNPETKPDNTATSNADLLRPFENIFALPDFRNIRS